MDTPLAQRLAVNGGVIRTGELHELGYTPSRIYDLVKVGDILWLFRDGYADRELYEQLDEFRGRPLLRARAAVRRLDRAWVASHDTSALIMGMPLIRPRESLVHVTRPGYRAAWTRAGITRHYARFSPASVQTDATGVRHLGMARTVVDLGRQHGELDCLVAADWAMRHGVPRSELIEAYLPMSHWPNITLVRSAVERADPRAETLIETLSRDLLAGMGFTDIDLQFPLLVGGRIYWADLRIGNHLFEASGKLKYLPVGEGGVAQVSPSEVVWREKKRAREIQTERMGISELFYEDFWSARRVETIRRLQADYDVTAARFGHTLDPRLAAQAAEIRRRHGMRDRFEAS